MTVELQALVPPHAVYFGSPEIADADVALRFRYARSLSPENCLIVQHPAMPGQEIPPRGSLEETGLAQCPLAQ